jgi:hypothetical protein
MKPTRIRMCHSLVMNYGLYKRMEIFVSEQGGVLFPLLAAIVPSFGLIGRCYFFLARQACDQARNDTIPLG